MGGKSTRHHIVAAWRTNMGRKMPVLKFGVMCRGTTIFYFWWFIDQDDFVLQAAFNEFFLTVFGFISHFIHFFSMGYYSQLLWVFTPFVHFFCDFVAEAFYISIYSTWRVNIDGYFFL